jgi:hypothetical protein
MILLTKKSDWHNILFVNVLNVKAAFGNKYYMELRILTRGLSNMEKLF